ncbi:DUF2508 family protein [Paenibacillus senegalensis]|uniref:DUF2508 family protein n=1 Tax=Paenibacillus senegalensis TaxID=1465766 RepID=UPI000287EE74|nr:DUF2508 family protein [Paenibacillus senegalensis]
MKMWWSKLAPAKKRTVWSDEKEEVLSDLQRAYTEWENAQYRLDWAVGSDEVDCAIYELVTAEKKYDLVLKKAKQLKWEKGFIYFEREVI